MSVDHILRDKIWAAWKKRPAANLDQLARVAADLAAAQAAAHYRPRTWTADELAALPDDTTVIDRDLDQWTRVDDYWESEYGDTQWASESITMFGPHIVIHPTT